MYHERASECARKWFQFQLKHFKYKFNGRNVFPHNHPKIAIKHRRLVNFVNYFRIPFTMYPLTVYMILLGTVFTVFEKTLAIQMIDDLSVDATGNSDGQNGIRYFNVPEQKRGKYRYSMNRDDKWRKTFVVRLNCLSDGYLSRYLFMLLEIKFHKLKFQ